jgi:hypothetical protein
VLFCSERNAVFARLDHARPGELHTVSKFRSHAREAAATLLKMAKTTSDPKVAARLIDAAASLQEEALGTHRRGQAGDYADDALNA